MPRTAQIRLAACMLASGVALVTAGARAQGVECGSSGSNSGELDVRPGDGADGVALDAPVIVRYLAPVDLDVLEASLPEEDVCDGELVCMFAVVEDDEGEPLDQVKVPGRVVRLDATTIAFVPDERLEPRSDYFPLIARPGFDTAARAEFEFRTGRERDREPPNFTIDRDAIRLAVRSLPPQCEAPAGSLRVGLAFPPAGDDGDEGSIEYLLYLSRGQTVGAPELRARERNLASTINMSFVLTPEETEAPVCIVLKAVDGVGKVAEREIELCFDPIQGNFFEPLCSVAGRPGAAPRRARPHAPTDLVFSALMLGLALVLRRSCRSYRSYRSCRSYRMRHRGLQA